MVLPSDAVLAPLFPNAPDLPSSLTIDSLPPGTMVLCHSALFHVRRARPAADPAATRYLVTVAYNEHCHPPERRFAAHGLPHHHAPPLIPPDQPANIFA